jgi:sigma-B regulation protein RsbQ
MALQQRNNVRIAGDGPTPLIFAHGFGCDQTMWRFMAPAFADRFKVITFDLVGSGASDLTAYDRTKYGTLHGYADDLLEIVAEYADRPAVVVGHSVSAMIGMLATIKAPERFAAQVMIGPSPCFINHGDYIGGFEHKDIDELLATMESNYLGWSNSIAPAIMGAPNQPHLGRELVDSFCRNDPVIARHFATVTFLADHRADVPKSSVPALILQSSDDIIAPREVGDWLDRTLPNSVLRVIENVGHCPHLSAPRASTEAIDAFLARALA